MQPVEGRREHLLIGRVREHVSRQLLRDELIVGHVVVKCRDYPITPRPHIAIAIHLVAVAIGVAGDVHPMRGHALAESRFGQIGVDHLAIGIGRCVCQKRVDLVQGRRQPGEVEGHPPDQFLLRRFRLQGKPLSFQPRQHKAVDRISHPPALALHLRRGSAHRRDECPVLFVFEAPFDPLLEQGDLPLVERQFRICRRHPLLGVVMPQTRHELPALDHLARPLPGIETKLPLAPLGIRPVTQETAIGEDRLDLKIVVDASGGLHRDHG